MGVWLFILGWEMKKTNSHISLEGHPIFIRGLHSWLRSDKNTEELWMNLNNSMNIWILNNPQNAGTHLNRHEVVTIKGLNVSKTSDLNMQNSFSCPADSSGCYCLKTDYKWKFNCFFFGEKQLVGPVLKRSKIFLHPWLSLEVVKKSLAILSHQKSLAIFGSLWKSSDTVGKSLETHNRWRCKISCMLLKKSWQVYDYAQN